jgi:hypothetical protein
VNDGRYTRLETDVVTLDSGSTEESTFLLYGMLASADDRVDLLKNKLETLISLKSSSRATAQRVGR